MIVVNFKGKEKHFAAEEISSMILKKIKEMAEAYLGTTVKNAVVTLAKEMCWFLIWVVVLLMSHYLLLRMVSSKWRLSLETVRLSLETVTLEEDFANRMVKHFTLEVRTLLTEW